MNDQKDIHRAALLLLNQYGIKAEAMALEKMRSFMDDEDVVGASAWLVISQAIQQLQQMKTFGTIH